MNRYDYEERQKRRNQGGPEHGHHEDDRGFQGSPSNQSNRFSSDYSSNERFDSGRGNDGRSHQSRSYSEFDPTFDSHSNLGGRSTSNRNDWGHDRTPSSQSYQPSNSTGENQFGSSRYDSGQSYGTSYSSNYGSQKPGSSGSFGQNSGHGSSSTSNQVYGRVGNSNQSQTRWGSDSSFESKSGRGPKGYKRSDERIKEEFSDLLTSHHEIDPSEVEIKVSNGEVTLTGTVESRQEKRLIEDLAEQTAGVSEVTNQLRVHSSHDSSRLSSSDSSHRSGQSQGLSGQASSGQKDGGQQSSKSIQ
jgi:osmotically-inducible protein OsmY